MMDRFDDKVFVVDKVSGPTSFDVVAQFRRATGLKKVGHTGTLDPLASGVLLLCSGKATRASDYFMSLEKEYEFTARLGVETTTLDAEGEVVRETPVPDFSAADIERELEHFVGNYEMLPPRYSAVRVGGRRLYELARRGEDAEAPARVVTIHMFELLSVSLPDVRLRVRCSRGTYVRSLAFDLGARLGVPAHVTELTRTRVGPFLRESGYPSDAIGAGSIDGLEGHPIGEALSFLPGVVLSMRSRRALGFGTLPGHQDVLETHGDVGPGAVRLLDTSGTLIAVGKRNDGAAHNRLCVVDSYRLFVEPTDLAEGASAAQ